MSKYEKTNMVVAIVGLCVAVLGVVLGAIAPFITYHWLDPQLQSFAHRPRFQISTLKQEGARKVAEFEFKKNEDFEIAFQRWAADVDNAFYSVVVTNVGELPAKML